MKQAEFTNSDSLVASNPSTIADLRSRFQGNHRRPKLVHATTSANCIRRGLSLAGLVWCLACLTGGGLLLAKATAPASERPSVLSAQRPPLTKPIEDVRVGDWVLAKDPDEAGPPTAHRVTALPRNWTEHWVHVLVEGGGELQATREHPFWARGRGWVDAKDLRVGDVLEDEAGRPVAVAAVTIKPRTADTFNLTVNGVHTYYALAGGTPVLVHNVNTYPDPAAPGIFERRQQP